MAAVGAPPVKLTELLVDEGAVDTEALAVGLKGLLGITSAGEIRMLEGWDGLSEKQKILATLLGLKAAVLLRKRERESVTPSETARLSGVALGTAKRSLRELLAARTIAADPKGAYFVSAPLVRRALEQLGRKAVR